MHLQVQNSLAHHQKEEKWYGTKIWYVEGVPYVEKQFEEGGTLDYTTVEGIKTFLEMNLSTLEGTMNHVL